MKFKVGDEVRLTYGSEVFTIDDLVGSVDNPACRCTSKDDGMSYIWYEDELELIHPNYLPELEVQWDYKTLSEAQGRLLDERQQSLDLYHSIIESQEVEIARLTKIIKDSIETLKTLRIS